MKRFGLATAASAFVIAAIPAWAQQATAPNAGPAYGYGHMEGWHPGFGWHAGMIVAPFVMLLALVGIVALIVWLVRAVSHGTYHHGHGHCPHCGYGHGRGDRGAALGILEERFARGEIGKDEFEEKRRLMGR